MPRCCSIFIQSERARLASPRAFTAPATWMAPPNSSSFSVNVVLPASGWEMIANVRRRATSSASGERDGDSAETAMSDMRLERLAGKVRLIKPHLVVAGAARQSHIGSGRTAFRLTTHLRGRPCLIGRVVMAWIVLFVAGLLEVGWAIGLKYTEGFTRLVPSVLTLVSMGQRRPARANAEDASDWNRLCGVDRHRRGRNGAAWHRIVRRTRYRGPPRLYRTDRGRYCRVETCHLISAAAPPPNRSPRQ